MPTYEYPRPTVAADSVVLASREDGLSLLLICRGGEPFKGSWALPGGFVEQDEPLADAAVRELREETGIELPADAVIQLGAYGDPARDPRGWAVSVVYLAMLAQAPDPTGGDDAAEARWWPLDALPEELAFDHAQIIRDALAGRRRSATP
jgi:8-oxo-dGTP diphosphatase